MVTVLITIVLIGVFLGIIVWWLNTQASFIDPQFKSVIKAVLILAYVLFCFWEIYALLKGGHP